MKRLAVLGIITFLFFSVASSAFYQRFTSGNRTRVEICHQIGTVKTILRDEHEVKLHRAIVFLRKHPNGTHDFTRQEILDAKNDEKSVLRKLQPTPCT